MIRLAIRSEDAVRSDLGAWLRGASVETYAGGGRLAALPDVSDAVLLLEPHSGDADLICQCLASGRHMLLAAQSWLTGDALEPMSSEARRSGVQLAVMNPDRFVPSRQLVRQQLDAGRLGEPGLVRMHRWEHTGSEREQARGDLPAPVARDIDIALWLMGVAPDLVYAVERLEGEGGSRPGRSILLHFGFPGGGMALIDYSDQLPPGDGYQSLSLIGSSGATYADDHQNMQLLYCGSRPQAVQVDERGGQIVALAQAFVSGLNEGHDLSESVTSWRRVMAVADAVQRSVALRQAIPLEGS